MLKNLITQKIMRPFISFIEISLIQPVLSLAGVTTYTTTANVEFTDAKAKALFYDPRIQKSISLLNQEEKPFLLKYFPNQQNEIAAPIVNEKKASNLSEYFEFFMEWVVPLTYEERLSLRREYAGNPRYYAFKTMFEQTDTSLFLLKSELTPKVWDIFYVCPLAPEIFCFIFALYNVCKAALLYYTYVIPQKASSTLIPVVHRNIALVMTKTLFFQTQLLLLLFINPVIFDRVLVMFTGIVMSHGFISFFKISCVFLFRFILGYILSMCGILNIVFAIETYCLISFMMLFSLLLFASNNLIFTLILFEAIFFCLIPLMSSAYIHIPKNWNVYYNLFTTKDSYKNLLIHYNTIKTPTFGYSSLAAYSTMQYFLYNAFFLGLYIFGLSFLFFFTHNFSYMELYSILMQGRAFGYTKLLAFCFFCIMSMVFFKMGLVPYHGWMLSVFSNVNIIPLMLLLLPFKLAIFSTGLRLFYGVLHPYLPFIQPFIFFIAFISMILGAFGMFTQLSIRKFLVYSTINHSGYILIAMSSGTILGIKASIFYIMIYIISTLGFLLFIGSTLNIKTNKPFTNFLEIASCSNLTLFPFITFFVILLSMAGIPPFAGFFAKLFVIDVLYGFGFLGWFGIFIIIITSTITVVGYLRIIKFFFIDHQITTSIMVKTYGLYSVQGFSFVNFFLVFFSIFYLIYYALYTDKDFYKAYAFFRLVL